MKYADLATINLTLSGLAAADQAFELAEANRDIILSADFSPGRYLGSNRKDTLDRLCTRSVFESYFVSPG